MRNEANVYTLGDAFKKVGLIPNHWDTEPLIPHCGHSMAYIEGERRLDKDENPNGNTPRGKVMKSASFMLASDRQPNKKKVPRKNKAPIKAVYIKVPTEKEKIDEYRLTEQRKLQRQKHKAAKHAVDVEIWKQKMGCPQYPPTDVGTGYNAISREMKYWSGYKYHFPEREWKERQD